MGTNSVAGEVAFRIFRNKPITPSPFPLPLPTGRQAWGRGRGEGVLIHTESAGQNIDRPHQLRN